MLVQKVKSCFGKLCLHENENGDFGPVSVNREQRSRTPGGGGGGGYTRFEVTGMIKGFFGV